MIFGALYLDNNQRQTCKVFQAASSFLMCCHRPCDRSKRDVAGLFLS